MNLRSICTAVALAVCLLCGLAAVREAAATEMNSGSYCIIDETADCGGNTVTAAQWQDRGAALYGSYHALGQCINTTPAAGGSLPSPPYPQPADLASAGYGVDDGYVYSAFGLDVLSGSGSLTSFTNNIGTNVLAYTIGVDLAYVTVTDADENLNPVAIETVNVTIVDAATGDAETIILTETGLNTGVFRNLAGVNSNVGVAIPGNGTIQTANGSLITATYTDDNDASDVSLDTATMNPAPTGSTTTLTNALGVVQDPYTIGVDPVYITVTDADENASYAIADTIIVTVTCAVTSDSEVVVLTETGVNTGVFRNTVGVTSALPPAGVGNGIIEANRTNLIVATYTDSDPIPADTSNDNAQMVSPVAIAIAPTTMTFNAVAGGPDPASQILQIWNSGPLTLNWTLTEPVPELWLNEDTVAGSVSGTNVSAVTVSVDISLAPLGTTVRVLQIADPNANNSPQTCIVTLNVWPAATAAIGFSPPSLTFNAIAGGANPPAQTLNIWNLDTLTALNWTVTPNAAWLSATPAAGVSNGETDPVAVSVNIAALPAGTYNSSITIAAAVPVSNSPQTCNVTLVVSPAGTPLIGYSPLSLSFNAEQGGANPPSSGLSVWNAGGGALNYAITDNVAWLSVVPNPITVSPGTSTGETDAYDVSVSVGALVAGTYNGVITIAAAGAGNTPRFVPVTLTVFALNVTAIGYTPNAMNFTAPLGTNPANQTLQVWNVSDFAPMNFAVADNAAWLTLLPINDFSNGPLDPRTITASVDVTGLAIGSYTATITITGVGAVNNIRQSP
jgi:hypothetical protein